MNNLVITDYDLNHQETGCTIMNVDKSNQQQANDKLAQIKHSAVVQVFMSKIGVLKRTGIERFSFEYKKTIMSVGKVHNVIIDDNGSLLIEDGNKPKSLIKFLGLIN